MEALSGAASGIAVVSLSIQLVECVGSIKTFIRNVKDAEKELERLADLLERLEALLEDVRALMERQASLEHFPTPSATIIKCLKSCEKTLEPLQATVDKYMPSKSKASTSMDRLKAGLRIGFKTKDIQEFETRIEREINFLHASLGANCGAILMQLGPVLLKSQSNHEIAHQSSTALSKSNNGTTVIPSRKDDVLLSNGRAIRPSSSIIRVHSPLEKIGIYQRKIVRRVPCTTGKGATDFKESEETIVSETHETTLLWSILGHGLTWIQRRSFGKVTPSLSTYPVVNRFPEAIESVFRNGRIQYFQDLLHRGVIHPFSRNCIGESLLHVAGRYGRADIYLMLRNLGLKQHETIYGVTPLMITLENDFSLRKVANPTIIYRYILEDPDMAEDSVLRDWNYTLFFWCPTATSLWFYQQSVNALLPEDSYALRARVIWDTWKRLCTFVNLALPIDRHTNFDIDTKILKALEQRRNPLLSCMFLECSNSYDSFVLGGIFLEWISNSDIDVEQFISHEVEIANASGTSFNCSKRIVFEPCEEGRWRLGFEFAFDREACGYLLASEYEALFADRWTTTWSGYGPSDKQYERYGYVGWESLQQTRFQRRMAAKARKSGCQKKRKSRMPGAWVH